MGKNVIQDREQLGSYSENPQKFREELVYLSFNFSLIGWEVTNEIGSVAFNLQTTVFDALLPGMVPLALVLGVWGLLKKRVKPTVIILLMFVLAFATIGLAALCGAY